MGTLAIPLLVVALAGPGAPGTGHLPPCLHGPFRGITPTDETGAIIGPTDRHDWGCLERHGRRGGPQGGVADAGPLDVDPVPPAPAGLCLGPAAPNPATVAVSLDLSIPRTERVEIAVYGQSFRHGPLRTRLVRTLIDADLAAGRHRFLWDLKDEAGARVPSGIYRAVLRAADGAVCGDIEVR